MKEKEAATSVTTVYLHVVEDVIQNIRSDFQSDGVDDSVLNELQALWELKMMQSGAIDGPAQEMPVHTPSKGATVPVTPVHDLNVPYDASQDYETPTADMLFPPTPTLTSTGEPVMYQYMLPGSSDSDTTGTGPMDTKLGRPAPYMPSPWMSQKPRGVDVNVAYEEGQEDDESNGFGQPPITKDFFTLSTGKRKREDVPAGFLAGNYIPQRDGAGDVATSHQGAAWSAQRLAGRNSDPRLWREERCDADNSISHLIDTPSVSGSSHIPQLDGIDDDYDDGVAEEDYNEPGEEEPQPANEAKTPKVEAQAVDSDGLEPPLNEDDDDDDLDDNDQGNVEPQTDHLVLAQFDKVTRSKNKWKCTLKDGIMHLNNRDILFVKATGEFEF